MKTENLSTLKIHKLTQAQYDRELEAGNLDTTALYLTPDASPYMISDSAPEDTSLLWVDTTDNTDDFEQVIVDSSLTQSGCAADAKATGDTINTITTQLNNMVTKLNNMIYIGNTAPTNVVDGMVWIDISEAQTTNNEVI
jgi:hypothetical protein